MAQVDAREQARSDREPVAFPMPAMVAACACFVLIGVLQALYGPAIPALRAHYRLSPSSAGTALSAHFAGALVGVLLAASVRRRWPDRRILVVSCLLMAVGAAVFAAIGAWAGSWPVALVGALVLGVGFGGVDYGLNVMVAEGFGRRGTAMLNILNAHFGLGAIAGPALLGLLGTDRYPVVFLACAGCAVLLVPPLLSVRDTWAPTTSARDTATTRRDALPDALSDKGTSRRRPSFAVLAVLGAFIALYILHVGIETGVGGWETTHLEALGRTAGQAATATAGFWLAMTVGRVLVAPVSLRWRPHVIVVAGSVGMTVCLLLAAIPACAPFAYLGVGLAIAPIFPTGLAWLAERFPGSVSAGAWVIAASMIGGIAFPPLLGGALQVLGVGSVPLVLAALAALCTAIGIWLHLSARTSHGSPDMPLGR